MTRTQIIKTTQVNKFQILDFINKGFRVYDIQLEFGKDRYSGYLYNVLGLDNFWIGNTLMVKNRKK